MVKGLKEADVKEITKKFEEETGLKFVFTEEGDLLKITAIGVNAHASLPHMGKNAIQGLCYAFIKISSCRCTCE